MQIVRMDAPPVRRKNLRVVNRTSKDFFSRRGIFLETRLESCLPSGVSQPLPTRIVSAVEQASSLYERLVLVVGPPKSGKTQALQQAAKTLNTTVQNVSLVLSEVLLDLSRKQRVLMAPRLFGDFLGRESSPVVLDNLELMFDADLKMDPLAALRQSARNLTIVASFPGKVVGDHLTYAEVGHPEYRTFPKLDLLLLEIDPTDITS